jgi:hypothetical protein
MAAWPAPPATTPPAGWATWTDALTAAVLGVTVRHDRHPLPGTGLRNYDTDVSPAVMAALARTRAQG